MENRSENIGIDPVCGMQVDLSSTAWRISHQGKDYGFCCEWCLKEFQKNPEKHLDPKKSKSVEHPTEDQLKQLYTCPMDPEVRQLGPGSCPKCGMALEAMDPLQALKAGSKNDPELKAMTWRFWVSAVAAVPVFVLAMGPMVVSGLGSRLTDWIQFGLTIVSMVIGYPFWKLAIDSMKNRSPNMFTLIGLGVFASFAFSCLALLFPGFLPETFLGHHGQTPLYFESVAVIVALVYLGQVLELRARASTKKALESLLSLAPAYAIRILSISGLSTDAVQEEEIPIDQIKKGDRIRVRPGDRIPVDGVIIAGESSINESMLTGEAMPVYKTQGSRVSAGTINGNGSLVISTDKTGDQTLLAGIVRSVAEASRSRAPIQSKVDQVAAVFVPAVVLISVASFVFWFFFGPEPRLAFSFLNAVAVLMVACPCALGLATPMSMVVGMGRAAQKGILFRNASALEKLLDIDTLVLDKTGTVTEGRMSLESWNSLPNSGFSADRSLALSASIERLSEHPIAKAIVEAATKKKLVLSHSSLVQDFKADVGTGVSARIGPDRIWVGKMEGPIESALPPDAKELVQSSLKFGKVVLAVRIQDQVVAYGIFSDRFRPTSARVVTRLQKKGIRVILLSGDRQETTAYVARELGIKEFEGGLLPDDKKNRIATFVQAGRKVAMAGDGINDSPALALARVGIAMGSGSSIAMETADVTLVKGHLDGIEAAIEISRLTVRNIRQNLFLAFLYNSLGIPVAAGLFYPIFGWLMSPMLASAAMSFSSVAVITNALRLRRGSKA